MDDCYKKLSELLELSDKLGIDVWISISIHPLSVGYYRVICNDKSERMTYYDGTNWQFNNHDNTEVAWRRI